MFLTLRRGSRVAATALLVMAMGFPALRAQESASAGNSKIQGKITDNREKGGVAEATVIAYHLSTKAFFYSEASNPKGEYRILGLPAGYYELAVRTSEGLFVGSSIVNVAPSRMALANFTVVPFDTATPGDGIEERVFPGSEGTVTGAAKVDKKKTKREFWRSPKGIAILGGAGTVALFAIVDSGNDETNASPF